MPKAIKEPNIQGNPMIVQVFETHSDDCESNDYEGGGTDSDLWAALTGDGSIGKRKNSDREIGI